MKNILLLVVIFCFNLSYGQYFESNQLFLKINDAQNYYTSQTVNTKIQEIFGDQVYASNAFQTNDYRLNQIFLIQINSTLVLDSVKTKLEKLSYVEYVEKIPLYIISHTPNDLNSSQYNLSKIEAEKAWDLTKGSSNIVVAVIDDAVQLNHPDLKANIWTNPLEIAGNNIDDDGNGWVDDVNGYDVANNDNNPNPVGHATSIYHAHGTHCAGIVSANTNNNLGVASIGYNLSIMAIKTGTEQWNSIKGKNEIVLRNSYRGIDYAIKNKANVISMSWGRDRGGISITEQTLFDVAYSRNIVCVAAAGNSYQNQISWPASYNHVISVASTDSQDKKSSFSSYHSSVDISAPGTGILSTVPGSSLYDYKSGTSMACPLVSGICGLMLSINPYLTPDEIESCLKSSADNINTQNPGLNGLLGAGRVNAFNALKCLKPIQAYFKSNLSAICPGGKVTFSDLSSPKATSWSWSFPGGSPSSSTLQNPTVTYNTAGKYHVKLTASNSNGTDVLQLDTFITVQTPTAKISGNATIGFGGAAFLRFDFTGVKNYKVVFSDGSQLDSFISSTDLYYHPVRPATTSTYTIIRFNDSLCVGSTNGSATISISGVEDTSDLGCLKLTQVNKISDIAGNFTGTLNDASFGQFMCKIGDLDKDGIEDLAIGAPRNTYNGGQKGSVFICFMNADGTVKSHTEIGENKGGFNVTFPSFSTYGYWFGFGVHSIGDFNKDGTPDIAVSCNNKTDRKGALWLLYLNSNGTVKSYSKIADGEGGIPSGTLTTGTSFGIGCDSIGDINNDGVMDLAIGGYRFNANGAGSSGAIWICLMNANGTVKSYNQYDKSTSFFSTLHGNSFLGISISSIGDLNKDGTNDIMVGASGYNDGGANTGAIFNCFLNSNGTIKSVKKLSKSNGLDSLVNSPYSFGYSCKYIGDINNDNKPEVIIGTPTDSEGGRYKGSLHLASLNIDGSLNAIQRISSQIPIFKPIIDIDDYFGMSVGVWKKEDTLHLYAGAPFDDDGGTNHGAVYLIDFIDSCKSKCRNETNLFTSQIKEEKGTVHSKKIIKSNDGNYLVLVGKETNTYSSLYKTYEKTIVLFKRNKSGQILWAKNLTNTNDIGSLNSISILNLIQAKDSSIYICMTNYTGSGSSQNFYLLKFDNDGNKVWTKYIQGSSVDYGSNLIEKSNGNIVIGGTISTYGSAKTNEFLGEVTPNGQFLWAKSFYTSGYTGGNYHLWSMFELNSSIYSVGRITPNGGGYSGSGTLKKHGLDGTLKWVKYLPSTGNGYAKSLVRIENDKLLYTGDIYSKGAGAGDFVLSLFDTSGNEIWTKAYGTTSKDLSITSFYSNGLIYVFGRTNGFYGGKLSTLGICIDMQGEIIWSHTYGTEDVIFENSVLEEKDGFILMTTDYSSSKPVVKIRKLNSCGESACSYDEVQITKTDLPKSFTNMAYATNSHNITLSNSNVNSTNIELKDSAICGQKPIKIDTCTLLASFTPEAWECADEAILFKDNSTDPNKTVQFWNWDFGDGTQINGIQHPKHTYKSNGLYTVTLIVGSGDGTNICFDTISKGIEIKKALIINTSVEKDTICLGDSTQLITKAKCGKQPLTYSWSPIAGLNKSDVSNPKASPSVTTQYIVTVRDSIGLIGKDTIVVYVNQSCCKTYASFQTNKESYCLGDTVLINENSKIKGNTTYKWTINPSAQISSFTGQNLPPLLFNSSGLKKVTLIIEDDCNFDTIAHTFIIHDLPQVDAGKDTAFCFPDTALLGTENLANISYDWQDALKVLSPTEGITKAYITAPETFYLYATEIFTGCTNMDSISISSKSNFKINLGKDTSYCFGDSIRLGVAEAGDYLWSTGETSQYIQFKGSGEVILKLTQGKCTSSDTIEVNQKARPTFTLGKDTTVCDSANFELKPNNFNPSYSYLWDNGSTDSIRKINQSGVYWLEISNNGCKSTDNIAITQLEGPKNKWIGSDTTICDGDILTLNADQGTNFNYLWQDGSTKPSISIKKDGYYEVVTSNICGSVTAGIQVDLSDCNCILIFPTAFTPNDKEPNNLFLPYPCPVREYKLTVYDRWGELIFTTNDVLVGWDGTFAGSPVMQGNYLYKVEYITKRFNRTIKIADYGIFTLLR